MRRAELIRKLRALANDPAATDNERKVAAAKADQIEALGMPSQTVDQDWWDALPPIEWNGMWMDLGPYSRENLHRALHIMPDGSMNCRCHGRVNITLTANTGDVTVSNVILGPGLS